MHKKDYLQRQLEEFGKVLATILSLKKNKEWDAFEKEVAEAVQKFTPLELSRLEMLSETEFHADVISSKLSFEQKKILANLLFEKMNGCLEKGEVEKYRKLKSLCLDLYTYLVNDLTQNEFDMEAHYRLQLLRS